MSWDYDFKMDVRHIKMLEIYIELWATNMISFEMDLKTVIIIL